MSTTTKTKAAWKKSAIHEDVLLPSGMRVDIRIIDLPTMVETGTFPQHLLQVALKEAAGEKAEPSVELLAQQREFTDLIVKATVVNPKIEDEDLPDLPAEDKALLVDLATRARDFDAEGVQIAGLDQSARWRKFRGFPDFDEDVEGS